MNRILISIFLAVMVLSISNCNLIKNESVDKSKLMELNFILPDGRKLDSSYWKNGNYVLYFGFSHCPDMCPLALTNFGRASLILGPIAKEFHFVFITLDPERDAPSVLSNYVNQFPGKNLQALSPANSSMKALEGLFQITRRKVETGKSYSIDHSNFIYVLDKNLKQIAAFPGGTSAVELSNQLRQLATVN